MIESDALATTRARLETQMKQRQESGRAESADSDGPGAARLKDEPSLLLQRKARCISGRCNPSPGPLRFCGHCHRDWRPPRLLGQLEHAGHCCPRELHARLRDAIRVSAQIAADRAAQRRLPRLGCRGHRHGRCSQTFPGPTVLIGSRRLGWQAAPLAGRRPRRPGRLARAAGRRRAAGARTARERRRRGCLRPTVQVGPAPGAGGRVESILLTNFNAQLADAHGA